MSNVLTPQTDLASDVKQLWSMAMAGKAVDFKTIEPAFRKLMQEPEYFAVTIPAKEKFCASLADHQYTDNYILSSFDFSSDSDNDGYIGIMANNHTISLFSGSMSPTRFTIFQLPVFDSQRMKDHFLARWNLTKESHREERYNGFATFNMNPEYNNPEWKARKALVIDIYQDPVMSVLLRDNFKTWQAYLGKRQ